MPSEEPGGAPSPVGLIREVVALGAAALATRGELAAVELTEARERAAQWIAYALVAAVLLLAALIVASLWIASIFWDTYRSEAIAAIALVYAVAGGSLMAWLLARVRSTPPLLQATLMELKQDCDALRGAARPPQ
jgi:uncharacterized membrane protein YqjE